VTRRSQHRRRRLKAPAIHRPARPTAQANFCSITLAEKVNIGVRSSPGISRAKDGSGVIVAGFSTFLDADHAFPHHRKVPRLD
jgi:hypothetical protein